MSQTNTAKAEPARVMTTEQALGLAARLLSVTSSEASADWTGLLDAAAGELRLRGERILPSRSYSRAARIAAGRLLVATPEKVGEDVLTRLAGLCRQSRLNDEALEYCWRVIEANPRNPVAYVEAGLVYSRQSEREKASDIFERAKTHLVDVPDDLPALARIARACGMEEEAERIVATLSASPAPTADQLFFLGEWLLGAGNLSSAAHFHRQAFVLDPTSEAARAGMKKVERLCRAAGRSVEAVARAHRENTEPDLMFPDALLQHLIKEAQARNRVETDAPPRSVMFVVNSLAMGGSERNAVTVATQILESGIYEEVTIAVGEKVGESFFEKAIPREIKVVNIYKYKQGKHE